MVFMRPIGGTLLIDAALELWDLESSKIALLLRCPLILQRRDTVEAHSMTAMAA